MSTGGTGPKPYIRPVSKTTWYMRQGRYKKYMLREVTCIIVALYSFLTIWGLAALSAGETQWNAFLANQQNTAWIVFHTIMLIYFTIYQTFDWFKLAPKAMPMQIGEKKVADHIIVIAHYVAWVVVTGLVFWLAGVI